MDWTHLVELLRGEGVELAPGLTDAEVVATEQRFGFRFPPDLREFLQTALPIGEDYPDWRSGEETVLRERLARPRDGVLFDVEHGFWLPEWGPRPESIEEALKEAGELVDAAPRLIPIYRGLMMPDEPHERGNAVVSVHQTDIVVHANDLEDSWQRRYWLDRRDPSPAMPRPIRFWDIDRFQEVRWGDGPKIFDEAPRPTGWIEWGRRRKN